MEFDRATLLQAFHDLGRAAWAEGTTIEIAVHGGSAPMLTFAAEMGVRTLQEAVALVASFYPRSQLQPKVQFGLEEIFSDLASDGSKPA